MAICIYCKRNSYLKNGLQESIAAVNVARLTSRKTADRIREATKKQSATGAGKCISRRNGTPSQSTITAVISVNGKACGGILM